MSVKRWLSNLFCSNHLNKSDNTERLSDYEQERVDRIIHMVLGGQTLSKDSLDGLGDNELDALEEFHRKLNGRG